LEQAESDYTQASSELVRAEARLKEIGGSVDLKEGTRHLNLIAPTTGSITGLSTAPGAYINDATAPIMTVSNLEKVWVTANVPEKDISFVRKDHEVDVTLPAYPGEIFHGTVAFISTLLDSDTRRNRMRITFSNPSSRLKPNMFAAASFRGPKATKILVPTSALLMNNDSTTVLVETSPWKFIRREVRPDYEEEGLASIAEGLTLGDRVVVKGGVLLDD
jgi:cobalt-zinc-cadmium efflux system membrane fusion protein